MSVSTWSFVIGLAILVAAHPESARAQAQDPAEVTDDPAQQLRKIGPLVLIGGHEDKKGGEEILREFVKLSGGDARVVVITAASSEPEKVAEEYREAFGRIKMADFKVVDIRKREEADRAETLQAAECATGVFFTGGSQKQLVSVVRNTKLDELLHRRNIEGQVIAGTSAGASMMSEMMDDSGPDDATPRAGMVQLSYGLDFMPGLFVDAHFAQRGRQGRLLSVLAIRPQSVCVGIDENTALIIRGRDRGEVIGTGAVTLVDSSRMRYNNREGRARGDALALFDVTMSVLPEGCRVDFRTMAVSDRNDPNQIGGKK